MTFETHLLVVANETLDSPELAAELERRAGHGNIRVSLLVPALPHQRASAHHRLVRAMARLSDVGVPADGRLGNGIALVAVSEVWDASVYDEVIISTLPVKVSSWLRVDLPRRVAGLTGAKVSHVPASANGTSATWEFGPSRRVVA